MKLEIGSVLGVKKSYIESNEYLKGKNYSCQHTINSVDYKNDFISYDFEEFINGVSRKGHARVKLSAFTKNNLDIYYFISRENTKLIDSLRKNINKIESSI